jgi:hypothetical protein
LRSTLAAADARIWADRIRVLPAEFAEPVVVNAEMVGDLVDDGTADLVVDLLLGAADGADRRPADGDLVGQDPRVLRCAAGERDGMPS